MEKFVNNQLDDGLKEDFKTAFREMYSIKRKKID